MRMRIDVKKILAVAGLSVGLSVPASAQTGTFFVEGDNVGIGISMPSTRLQIDSYETNKNVMLVRTTDGDQMFRLYETSATGSVLSMYDSAGNEDFRLSPTGDSWFNSAGEVGIDCRSPDHDLTIGGTGSGCNTGVYSEIDAGEAQFTVSSSREIKENLVPMEAEGILDEIVDVGVYAYDFIDGPKDKIGIMAEDFHEILERGSDKSINGQEVQMVLWLAVQQLATRNQELESRNDDLAERLARLEGLISSR